VSVLKTLDKNPFLKMVPEIPHFIIIIIFERKHNNYVVLASSSRGLCELLPKMEKSLFVHIDVCKKAPEIRPSSLQDPQKGYDEQGLQQSCPVSLINISFKKSGNHHLQRTLHKH